MSKSIEQSGPEKPVTDSSAREAAAQKISRRTFLGSVAAGGAVVATPRLLAGASSALGTTTRASSAEKPRYGGRLRVGMVGGTVASLDPGLAVAEIDSARATNLFDRLVNLTPQLEYEWDLALSMEPNAKATVWTIRLRPDVHWHDGSPFTADDVIFCFRRWGAPKSILFGSGIMALVHLPGLKKLDRLTLQVPLKQPISEFPALFITPQAQITKNGQTNFHIPIGTGPFKFKSFTPGRQSVFTKNTHYWRTDQPYVDELLIIDISDPTARLNALLTDAIDAMDELPYPTAKVYKDGRTIRELVANGSSMVPIYMAVNMEPFKDVRVRQAMRLIAGRPQLVEIAQDGFGTVGNDVFGFGLPNYDRHLPQRERDIPHAKSLLKAAGREDLSITLWSANAAPAMLQSATVFAQQATAAGVKVNINNGDPSTYYGPQYLKQNFAQTQWNTTPMYNWISQALAPTAPFNETHWHDPEWDRLLATAEATIDAAKRLELYYEMENILWDRGGYLIWGFYPQLDGLSLQVRGAIPNASNELGNWQFRTWWLA